MNLQLKVFYLKSVADSKPPQNEREMSTQLVLLNLKN